MVIGRIAGTFGVRGELKVEPLTDDPGRFEHVQTAFLGAERRPYTLERSRPHGPHVVVKLTGVETPEAGARLRDTEIAIPRDQAIELPGGHYFLDDLLGMTVLRADGQSVGVVSDVLRTGANDVYVVGSGKNAILIPAIRDAIAELDLDAGRIVVESWVLEHTG